MKPANLNQLLFHPKSDSLSFYLPSENLEEQSINSFLEDIEQQLLIQNLTTIAQILDKNKNQIKKIARSHPGKSHGFFISEDLQGYIILDQRVDSFCIMGQTFHVRPLLEEVFVNPEYFLVNVSSYDVKIYRGDFQHIEIIHQFEFDEHHSNDASTRLYAPQFLGLIPYKTIMALKTIAYKAMDETLYQNMPVIITGLEEPRAIFLKYFNQSPGIISHFKEDFHEKTCMQIVESSKKFRYAVMDFYSAQLKDRLKRMLKSKRLIHNLEDIIIASFEGRVEYLIIPPQQKIWGKLDHITGEFIIHKKLGKTSIDILNELAEEVIRQGGKIQILGAHFFPLDSNVLAILRG